MSFGLLHGFLLVLRHGSQHQPQPSRSQHARRQRNRPQRNISRRAGLAALLACVLAVSTLITSGVPTPAQAAGAEPRSISVNVTTNPAPPPNGGVVGTGRSVLVQVYTLAGDYVEWGWDTPTTINNLPAGSYRIKVSVRDSTGTWAPTWYGNVPRERDGTIVELGDTPVRLDVMVDYAGFISGHIASGALTGVPEGLTATAFLYDARTQGYEFANEGVADAEGNYRITGLAPGPYLVKFSQSAELPAFGDVYYGGSADAADTTLVTVEADSTASGIAGKVPAWTNSVTRVAGADRFATSVAVSQVGFNSGVPVVYLANGLNWPDALSAGPAAAYLGGPLLLVAPDLLPEVVKAELERLQPQRIVVVGGPRSVSEATFSQISALAPAVVRLGGADRYETSRAVILDAFGPRIASRAIFVVTGRNFPDALGAGAAAATLHAPVLLVDGAQFAVDQPTADLLHATIFTRLTVVGGPASMSPEIATDLKRFTKWEVIDRIGGADRYETNRLLNRAVFPIRPLASESAFLATGTGFADALSGGPLAALTGAPMFLTSPQCVASGTIDGMRHLNANSVTVLGGLQTLGAGVDRLTPC